MSIDTVEFKECYKCKKPSPIDDVYTVADNIYCSDCYNRLFRQCVHCLNSFPIDEVYTVADDIYCPDCYSKHWFYCDGCGEDLSLDDQCICNRCSDCCNCKKELRYEQNPKVSKREVMEVCKIIGIKYYKMPATKYPLGINKDDYKLPELAAVVGLLNESLYVYGLKDREEYNLLIPPDKVRMVSKFLERKGWKYMTGDYCRLAISYSLRDKEFDNVAELIKLMCGKPKKEKLLCAV